MVVHLALILRNYIGKFKEHTNSRHENSKTKIPSDSCEYLSINWKAAGSRLPYPVMEFFFFLLSNILC